MIESRAVLLALLVIMLSGFAFSASGRMDIGGMIILVGVVLYFFFNRKG